MENARRLVDQEERMRSYRQAQTILVEEAPILPLNYSRLHVLVKPWVRQLRFPPAGVASMEDIIIEPH